MDPIGIALSVFTCVFAGACFGKYAGMALPKHQLGDDTKDTVKSAMALVSTMAALVLGLMTASAKGSLDRKESDLRNMAAQLVLLDRMMADYGSETQDIRVLLERFVGARISRVWPEEDAGEVAEEEVVAAPGIERIQQNILALSPQTDAQRWFQSTALQVTREIAAAQQSIFQQVPSQIKWPFVGIISFWLTIVFTSFGLFSPSKAVAVAGLFVGSIAVAAAIYLILAMDQPYSGLIKISSGPLRSALDQLGR
jgi:hypothetical protein